MNSVLAFIQQWGWLIGIVWLTALILWPSEKRASEQKFDVKQVQHRLADMPDDMADTKQREIFEREKLRDRIAVLGKRFGDDQTLIR